MYDYKFRHDDASTRRAKRPVLKLALGSGALALIGAALLAVLQTGAEPDGSATREDAPSGVIPLTIPPRADEPREPGGSATPDSGGGGSTVTRLS
jgi:hypothetical protein